MSTLSSANFSRITAAIILLATAACGGGGGGGGGGSDSSAAKGSGTPGTQTTTTTTTTNTTTTNPSTLASEIVTVVSPANYDPASENGAAYEYLNAQRQLCGFGLLQQDTRIDAAATAHANYMALNNVELTHYENKDQFSNGFTGAEPGARLITADYTFYSAGEVAGTADGRSLSEYGHNPGRAGVMGLFTAPYHGIGMLWSQRDVGFGFVRQTTANTSPRSLQVIDFGTTSTRREQLLDATTVATYPCNGTTGLLSRSYGSEIPTPIEGRDIGRTPIGHPIYLKVRDGNTLTVISADLRAAGANESVPLITRTRSNDTSGEFPDDSVAFFMPNTPLATNTTYAFKATVANNGVTKDISFTFATGAY